VVSKIRKTLARNIRHFRKLHNLSQETLGFKCGMSNVYISRIESGDFAVSIDTLDRIAKALGVKPGLLLEPEAHRKEKD
jgi:transcriptional regulator with XRE-family HTH domain